MGPGAVTVAAIVAVWVRAPLVPVTVTVKDPPVEPLRVHVEVWLPEMLDGLHDVETPDGDEEVVRSTVPVKPPLDARLTVEVAVEPVAKETLVGFAESEKSGPPAPKNSTGEAAPTSPWPRFPPPQTSSRSLMNE